MALCCTKPAFVKRAFLVCAQVENTGKIISGRLSPYPSIDALAANGVSTGLMLPCNEVYAGSNLIVPQIMKYVTLASPECNEWTEILTGLEQQALKQRVKQIWEQRSHRLVLIDTGSNLELADMVVQHLLSLEKAACTAETINIIADEMLGTLVCGSGNWDLFFGDVHAAKPLPGGFPMPQQSWTFTSRTKATVDPSDFILGGFVCWSGRGLVRIDQRQSMTQVGVRPGEGFLRLEQIVNELMSKIGAIPKFGA